MNRQVGELIREKALKRIGDDHWWINIFVGDDTKKRESTSPTFISLQ
jgi:hypothetical protein